MRYKGKYIKQKLLIYSIITLIFLAGCAARDTSPASSASSLPTSTSSQLSPPPSISWIFPGLQGLN